MTQPVPPNRPADPLITLPGEFTLNQTGPTRHVVINRWLRSAALTIGIILMLITLTGMVTLMTVLGGLRERLNDTTPPAPEPAYTDCPWGDPGCDTP